jgi:hypothetical protein
VHLDGARLWNACAATGTAPAAFAACAATVMVSFSKGLGAPVGAVLAGDEAAMADAWPVRKRMGGGMRQSGILAAGALFGLDHHRDGLADDHRRARGWPPRSTAWAARAWCRPTRTSSWSTCRHRWCRPWWRARRRPGSGCRPGPRRASAR